MSSALCFKRILLKLSGEALQGEQGSLDPAAILHCASLVKEAHDCGCQLALIVGAGNIYRGLAGSKLGMQRNCADYIGMLGTCMNALALRQGLEAVGLNCELQSSLPIPGLLPAFDYRQADKLLQEGTVVLFAAGTGHPFFTTDTTAALRASEIGADAVFKATKVNGVYSADPVKNPEAVRYEKISFAEALAKRLKIMDSTAFSLCQDNELPIVVFKFGQPGLLSAILGGDFSNASIVGPQP
ncbi:MAG: UMP kinase [Lentisphaeria bacterium]|jgi:uridylate kinase|nr:UMP kinase [Lentisphaeria bacterium]MDY0175507.1 UMP kinase [Lentisphaeria bacterium]NLZ60652.1 UMP kinase [Lentisphaerota bacterium]